MVLRFAWLREADRDVKAEISVSERHEVSQSDELSLAGLNTSMTTMRPRWQAGHSIKDAPVIFSYWSR